MQNPQLMKATLIEVAQELRLAFYRAGRQLTSSEIERNTTLRMTAP